MLENRYVVDEMELEKIYSRYKLAMEKRLEWEPDWNECYDFALPQKGGLFTGGQYSKKKSPDIFDSTAESGVAKLAGSILSELTPPWSRWFGLGFGVDVIDDADTKSEKYKQLEKIQKTLQSHFDRSNFYVEAHQCYLDLITIGTAVMLMEENQVGDVSAFKFTAVPMNEIALEENLNGKLDTVFRRTNLSLLNLKLRFSNFEFDEVQLSYINKNPDEMVTVIEAVLPRINACGQQGYNYVAFVIDENNCLKLGHKFVLKTGVFANSPFICFRWMKVPSEIYGRSPVMSALPDIKTANKVVELILKNASIAVSGVWQADDDGVLNIENITLAPGTIIPKAVGSSGLTPLRTGADFDVSQLVLSDLRAKINHSLLVDQILSFNSAKMTATEVIERTNQMSRILGATYGRLQSEFLTPVILRAVSILKRRGEIEDIFIDGHEVDLKYQSPLAKNQAVRDAENILAWIKALSELGTEATNIVDKKAVALWLAKTFSVPENLIDVKNE
ncbi:MAG: head-tail connector protein [bacterium]|nr:head-tail connector protein [bacterium]